MIVRAQKPYQVQVVQMRSLPEIINKIHDIVLNDSKVKVREIAEIALKKLYEYR